jgi:predicted branched-subunit amino acid permease
MASLPRATVRDALSVSLTVGSYGVAFGAAGIAAGFSVLQTCLFSALIYLTHLGNSHNLTAARVTVAAAAPPTNVHNGPRSLSSPRIRPENTGMNS